MGENFARFLNAPGFAEARGKKNSRCRIIRVPVDSVSCYGCRLVVPARDKMPTAL